MLLASLDWLDTLMLGCALIVFFIIFVGLVIGALFLTFMTAGFPRFLWCWHTGEIKTKHLLGLLLIPPAWFWIMITSITGKEPWYAIIFACTLFVLFAFLYEIDAFNGERNG